MSLEFNVGEVAQRVRRALAVRGRMPLDLDERCSIQVQGLDADRAPYRGLDGASCYGLFQAPVGGATQYVGIIVDPGLASTLVVRSLRIRHGGVAVLDIYAAVIASGGLPSTQLLYRPEIFTRSPFSLTRGPAGFQAALSVAGTPFLTAAGSLMSMTCLAGQDSQQYAADITVGPGFQLYLEARTPNVNWDVSLQGQSFAATVGT